VFRDVVLDIFAETWPAILICCVILMSMRIVYLFQNRKPLIIHKELLSLIFVIYIMSLFYAVTFHDVDWSSHNFIPFREITRYSIDSRMFYYNVIGNMVMFIPYGFFIGYFLKIKKVLLAFLLILFASYAIETTQYLIGRVFDVDDIILNVTGGMIGFGLYWLLEKIRDKLPDILKKPIMYNIIIIIVLILFIFYLIRIGA